MTTYPPGTVVRYTPTDVNRHDRMWCREGVALANDRGILLDTYWGCGSEQHVVRDDELPTAVVLFNVNDYDELPHAARGTWTEYRPEDRQQVPSQHGLQNRLLVRKGARPDHATKVDNARAAVVEAKREVERANGRLDSAHRWLAHLQAAEVSR